MNKKEKKNRSGKESVPGQRFVLSSFLNFALLEDVYLYKRGLSRTKKHARPNGLGVIEIHTGTGHCDCEARENLFKVNFQVRHVCRIGTSLGLIYMGAGSSTVKRTCSQSVAAHFAIIIHRSLVIFELATICPTLRQ